MNGFHEFLEIRRLYAALLPEWMDEYERTGEMRHDPYFINWKFSPIEKLVWAEIRDLGLPFYPQMPALNYFIDFGCPFLKIGIECDGKAWHDSDLDRARDARLAAQGWMIFRIEGHECMRFIEPWGEGDEPDRQRVYRHFLTTSEGVLRAIKRRYFDDSSNDAHDFDMDATLFEHMSTPRTFPVRKALQTKTGPRRVSDLLPDYLERLRKFNARVAP